jgi:hypothetical protein
MGVSLKRNAAGGGVSGGGGEVNAASCAGGGASAFVPKTVGRGGGGEMASSLNVGGGEVAGGGEAAGDGETGGDAGIMILTRLVVAVLNDVPSLARQAIVRRSSLPAFVGSGADVLVVTKSRTR